MPKPTSAGKQASSNTPRMSVVLLTMDSHLASAAESAAERLARDLPGLHLQTHSASAWRDSDQALAACLAAMVQADLVIVTMLFMEDHFLPVLDALQARRDLSRRGRVVVDSCLTGRHARGRQSPKGREHMAKD